MPCEWCYGTGRYLEHAPDCDDDLCALNGDYLSCVGSLQICCCPVGRRLELPAGLRQVYWLAHPKMQVRHGAEQMPHRWRPWWHWKPGAGPYLYRHRRWSHIYGPDRYTAQASNHTALLAELLEDSYGF